MNKLLDKFAIAQVLLQRCQRELMKRGPGAAELGVTIVVHAAVPDPDNMHMAVASMLSERSQMRAVFGTCIVSSLAAEGVPEDQLAALAADDYTQLFRPKEDT
jgi:hypothetical protein